MKHTESKDTEFINPAFADVSTAASELQAQLSALQDRLRELSPAESQARADVQLEIGRVLVGLGRGVEAWSVAREAFDSFVVAETWEKAVAVCDVLFRADQPGSLSALGQGIWLAVTFPINPELTLAMLQHVVDETPADSDGAAVAAAAAVYLVDLRAAGTQRERLQFFANQLLGNVARRHDNVEHETHFEIWVQKLELDDPSAFLPRLRTIVDVLVQDDWWIDRDALQTKLPVN
jgi:hypothetical protein